MSRFKEFTVSSPRPLPVVVLADVSGSMSVHGKIDVLNSSIETMVRDFARQDDRRGEVHVAVIAFGGQDAYLAQPPQRAGDFQWTPMKADGKTPMGQALDNVRELLEDRDQIPSRSYRPTLILVSDGEPTDDWEAPLRLLLESERASKAFRVAVAIGADANRDVLRAFLGHAAGRVFDAHEAGDISEFFQRVTMSVSRALSAGDYQTLDVLDITDGDDLDALDA
jgi:uncharacterized protein YegL